MRLILREALPAGEVAADLDVHLEGHAGWAVAPRFNGAVHAVRRIGDRLEVEITPDAWRPEVPLDRAFAIADGIRQPDPVPGPGTLLMTCQQFLRDGRRDFRDLRIELPVPAADAARAVTLHEAWTVPAPVLIHACTYDGYLLTADLTVGGERLQIAAERRGLLLRGRWRRDGDDGPVWGRLAVDPPPCTRDFAPGMLLGEADLAATRRRIAAGSHAAAWRLLADRSAGWTKHAPRPHARPAFVHWSEPGAVRDLKEDCEAAWGCTLLDALGHGDGHAATANRIIAAWAGANQGIADTGGHLSFSYCLPALVWAAELLRANGRLEPSVEAVATRWLAEVVRPIARTDLHRNNWRAWAVHLDACIAVFCRRGDWFDLALARHRELIELYTHSPSGITSETGRDLVHAQMGLAPLLATCELAWRQGLDLYAERSHRLRAAVELHGPFAMGRLDGWPLAQPARDAGLVWPMYELAARHWHGRLGMPMPRTLAVLAANRPERFDRIGWGTLLHPWEDEVR